jgi:hypothetical protein
LEICLSASLDPLATCTIVINFIALGPVGIIIKQNHNIGSFPSTPVLVASKYTTLIDTAGHATNLTPSTNANVDNGIASALS